MLRVKLLLGPVLNLLGLVGPNVAVFLLVNRLEVEVEVLCRLLLSIMVLGEMRNTCLPMLVKHSLFSDLICDRVIHFTFGVKACPRLTIVWLSATFRDPRTATFYV